MYLVTPDKPALKCVGYAYKQERRDHTIQMGKFLTSRRIEGRYSKLIFSEYELSFQKFGKYYCN